MTDWNRVQRLRAKGYDWKAVADDPKVGFTPAEGVGDPGRALKALYLARKSHSSRRSKSGSEAGVGIDELPSRRWGGRLEVLGVGLILGGIVWTLTALAYPSVAVVLPALPPKFPDIFLVVCVGAALLAVPLVLGLAPLEDHWKKGVAAGLGLAVMLAGGAGLFVIAEGIPNLSSATSAGPGVGWEKAPNPEWESGGKPVVFFYGSEACPFCSASSWAIERALSAFGSLTGIGYSSSNPGDTYPDTPEVTLAGSSLTSAYLSWDVKEGADRTAISEPPVSLTEQAYLNAYSDGIPFVVVGGTYIHTGTIVNPASLIDPATSQPYSPAQVSQSLANASPNDPVYSAIESQVVFLEAYCAKACQNAGITPPSSVTSDASVASVMAQI